MKKRKKNNNNKKYLYLIIVYIIASIYVITNSFNENPSNKINTKYQNTNIIENYIESLNSSNELIVKEVFNDINYYLYTDNNNYSSYFINTATNKVEDIYSIIKPEEKENFDQKIEFLLNLKYPKFITEILLNNSDKNYYVKDNEIVIYFSNYNIDIEEKLYLTVNYNEIHNYLNITHVLDEIYENEDGFKYDSNKPTVALSFDDGPNGHKTLELLDILNENKSKATFFMVGNKMKSGEVIVTTVYNSGNEIGSHTYNHSNFKKTKIKKIIENEELTNQIFYELTGSELKLTRPPYGSINQTVKESLDTIFVNWSIDTEDWRYKDVEHIKNAVLDNVVDGDIILMHDSYQTTVEAVKELLPLLYLKGYQVVTVSELAELKGVTLEHNTIYNSFHQNN